MRLWKKTNQSESDKQLIPSPDAAPPLPMLPRTVAVSSSPLPSIVDEDAPHNGSIHNQITNWVDEAFAECERNGGMEHLKGKGKPLPVPTDDILNGMMKHAGFLPPWLQLQHEIRDDLKQIVELLAVNDDFAASVAIDNVNEKVRKYNNIVPNTLLQKTRIFKEHVVVQLERWL